MYIRIVIDNIGKSFGERLLFSNISAEVASRQCLAVTGCNGSGKSTLLKIIAGLVRPSTGRIGFTLDNTFSPKERINYTGFVSPDVAMYAALTGIENIIFWTKVRGVACSKSESEKLCCQVGLGRAGGDPVSTYSTGMRQRLKLAVIKAMNPPVWLLDEPSSNLDVSGRTIVKELIADAVGQNACVILATNEVEEALYANSKIEL
ncbi:Linearmycin resistance ATP-binding protein LnrL [Sporomusa carbonis]|uniref:ABC transporter ATP-binding protein n=1 Tax=Sporomusa carbonis TaxID=3076075 RepID=UPI003A604CCD